MIAENSSNELDTLLIFCFENVNITDRSTFHGHCIGDIKITYWMEDSEHVEDRIANMYRLLFQETEKGTQITKITLINK